jgi:hypothetical protein
MADRGLGRQHLTLSEIALASGVEFLRLPQPEIIIPGQPNVGTRWGVHARSSDHLDGHLRLYDRCGELTVYVRLDQQAIFAELFDADVSSGCLASIEHLQPKIAASNFDEVHTQFSASLRFMLRRFLLDQKLIEAFRGTFPLDLATVESISLNRRPRCNRERANGDDIVCRHAERHQRSFHPEPRKASRNFFETSATTSLFSSSTAAATTSLFSPRSSSRRKTRSQVTYRIGAASSSLSYSNSEAPHVEQIKVTERSYLLPDIAKLPSKSSAPAAPAKRCDDSTKSDGAPTQAVSLHHRQT